MNVIRFPVCLLAGALFFSGCATSSASRSAIVRSPSLSGRIMLNSVPYLPAENLARALKGEGVWDAEAQVWTLRSGTHELRVASQMPTVLLDGSPHRLLASPQFHEGRLYLPERLWSKHLAGWSRAPAAAPIRRYSRMRTIVLDPGHGGHDPGAIGPRGLREKQVALDVAMRLRDLLVRDGFRVVMTRYDDRFIPLRGRSAIANKEGADLFISIHANASRRRSVSGYEAYYLSEATNDHARAMAASENAKLPDEMEREVPEETQAILWDLLYTEHRAESTELAAHICRGLSRQKLPSRNRGVKSARFAVLKGSRMPSVLIEVGFLSHYGEEQRLRQSGYRQRLAEGIRAGLMDFRTELERRYARRQ